MFTRNNVTKCALLFERTPINLNVWPSHKKWSFMGCVNVWSHSSFIFFFLCPKMPPVSFNLIMWIWMSLKAFFNHFWEKVVIKKSYFKDFLSLILISNFSLFAAVLFIKRITERSSGNRVNFVNRWEKGEIFGKGIKIPISLLFAVLHMSHERQLYSFLWKYRASQSVEEKRREHCAWWKEEE